MVDMIDHTKQICFIMLTPRNLHWTLLFPISFINGCFKLYNVERCNCMGGTICGQGYLNFSTFQKRITYAASMHIHSCTCTIHDVCGYNAIAITARTPLDNNIEIVWITEVFTFPSYYMYVLILLSTMINQFHSHTSIAWNCTHTSLSKFLHVCGHVV